MRPACKSVEAAPGAPAGSTRVRPGFDEIVSGWMLVDDFNDLTDRIEQADEWTRIHGPLEDDEQKTLEMMIQCQIAKGIARGDFEPFFPRADNRCTTHPDETEYEP